MMLGGQVGHECYIVHCWTTTMHYCWIVALWLKPRLGMSATRWLDCDSNHIKTVTPIIRDCYTVTLWHCYTNHRLLHCYTVTPITDIGPCQSQPNVTFPDRVTTGGGEWASGNLRGDGDDNNFLAGVFGKTERPNRWTKQGLEMTMIFDRSFWQNRETTFRGQLCFAWFSCLLISCLIYLWMLHTQYWVLELIWKRTILSKYSHSSR